MVMVLKASKRHYDEALQGNAKRWLVRRDALKGTTFIGGWFNIYRSSRWSRNRWPWILNSSMFWKVSWSIQCQSSSRSKLTELYWMQKSAIRALQRCRVTIAMSFIRLLQICVATKVWRMHLRTWKHNEDLVIASALQEKKIQPWQPIFCEMENANWKTFYSWSRSKAQFWLVNSFRYFGYSSNIEQK